MSAHLALGAGPEFDRIRAVLERIGPAAAGVGDDCAVIPLGGTHLVASIDVSLEGVHFRRDWLSLEEIGWRAAAAALSDLAAEGAAPIGVLVSLGIPGAASDADAAAVMAGVANAVQTVGGRVLGGDLARAERWLVDVCVLGTAERPVTRGGARAGDTLWVTGALGAAARALAGLAAGRPPEPALRARYARPEPRIAAGRWLAARGARALIDVSDGFAADAGHLAAASGVGVRVALEHLPCAAGATPLEAAASGEEFELVVAMGPEFGAAEADVFRREVGLPLTAVGACVAGAGVTLEDHGRAVPAPPGFDHFARA